jgi:hypothetical protein
MYSIGALLQKTCAIVHIFLVFPDILFEEMWKRFLSLSTFFIYVVVRMSHMFLLIHNVPPITEMYIYIFIYSQGGLGVFTIFFVTRKKNRVHLTFLARVRPAAAEAV